MKGKQQNAGSAQAGAESAARALGWFSIGLGVAQCVAPRAVLRIAGINGSDEIVRGLGVREIVSGIGILTSRDPTPWMWARVAGDMIDIAALAAGISKSDTVRTDRSSWAMLGLVGATAVDFACATALSRAAAAPSPQALEYRHRTGFPRPAAAMRGAGLQGFQQPADLAVPNALRPWNAGVKAAQ